MNSFSPTSGQSKPHLIIINLNLATRNNKVNCGSANKICVYKVGTFWKFNTSLKLDSRYGYKLCAIPRDIVTLVQDQPLRDLEVIEKNREMQSIQTQMTLIQTQMKREAEGAT